MELFQLATIALGVFAFELAAWRWGVDSTDGLHSQEWERRRHWRGFLGAERGDRWIR